MKRHIMNFALTITLILIALFSQSCIQGGDRIVLELTEAEKEEIIERAAEKMAEQHKEVK